jgi:hypothetical protein
LHRNAGERDEAVERVELGGMIDAGRVMVSITLGTVFGSTLPIAAVAPGAHTPKLNCCGVDAHVRAEPAPNPSCPVRATVKTHPATTDPNADRGRTIVAVSLGWSTTNCVARGAHAVLARQVEVAGSLPAPRPMT